MRRTWAIAQLSFWILLLVAFCFLGLRPIFERSAVSSIRLINATSFHSTDALLSFATEHSDLSNRLIEFFNASPANTRVVILERSNDVFGTLLGELTAYLSWPHPVKRLELTTRDVESAGTSLINDPIPTSSIAFCRLDPPANFPGAYRFGEGLSLVPLGTQQK